MTFNINKPYNPADYGYSDPLQDAIFQALNSNINNNFTIQISTGFYNPTQMTTELTNRFNDVVSLFIINFLFNNFLGYLFSRF
jgi:hypothetical protein